MGGLLDLCSVSRINHTFAMFNDLPWCGAAFVPVVILFNLAISMGPSIKYVTLEGEGVQEGVTGGGGPRACDITLFF